MAIGNGKTTAISNLIVPDEILDFMARCERFSPKAYQDHGTPPRWAVGYGHTSATGPPEVTADTVWDEGQAYLVFHADIRRFADEVRRVIKFDGLTDMQFGALVSLAYNMGTTKFKKTAVVAFINDPSEPNHLIKAAAAMLNHTSARDKNTGSEREFLGLKARRIREAAYFLHDWPLPI